MVICKWKILAKNACSRTLEFLDHFHSIASGCCAATRGKSCEAIEQQWLQLHVRFYMLKNIQLTVIRNESTIPRIMQDQLLISTYGNVAASVTMQPLYVPCMGTRCLTCHLTGQTLLISCFGEHIQMGKSV